LIFLVFVLQLYRRENNKLITWQVMVTGPTFKIWVMIIIAAALFTAELIANDELLRTLIAYGKRVVGNGLSEVGRSLTKWKSLWSNERRNPLHRILNSFIGDSFFMTTFKGTGQRHSIFVLFQLYSGVTNRLFRCVSFHFHECLNSSYFFDWLSVDALYSVNQTA
jgi:hypothetical protein